MNIRCTNEISKPPTSIFPWIADPARATQWQKDVKNTEILINTPEVTGTTFKEIVSEGRNELEMTGVVTRFSPDEHIAFHLSSRVHDLDVSYALKKIGNGTRITVEATIRWKFPLNLASLVLGKRMKRQLTEQIHAETELLKKLCERE